MSGFKAFLLRGNLVELAVAFVLGVAFAALVTAFVADIITPIIAAIGGKPDFSSLSFTINHSRFLYGSFINALVTFVIVAVVMYFLVVVPYTRMRDQYKPEPAPTPTRECPFCTSGVAVAATRCPFCTSELSPAT
jgi:large conductance mechanosensitive channel